MAQAEKLETKVEPRVRERVVDSAEPDYIREKLLEIGWIQKSLYSGDYWFFAHDFKKVGITRKTVSDLLGSIIKKPDPKKLGRGEKSFGQHLTEMQDYYDIKIILLEGSWDTISPRHQIVSGRGIEYYTWNMVWNFLRTWQDRGFSLELTANEGHTIRRLNELYAYYQNPSHTGGLNKRNIVGDPRILALQCGGIGIKYGQVLLEHFGSLQNIANAAIEDFLKVGGIGEKRAEALAIHFKRGAFVTKEETN